MTAQQEVRTAWGSWATQIEQTTLVCTDTDNYYLVPSQLYQERYQTKDFTIDDNYTSIGRDVAEAMLHLALDAPEPAAA